MENIQITHYGSVVCYPLLYFNTLQYWQQRKGLEAMNQFGNYCYSNQSDLLAHWNTKPVLMSYAELHLYKSCEAL